MKPSRARFSPSSRPAARAAARPPRKCATTRRRAPQRVSVRRCSRRRRRGRQARVPERAVRMPSGASTVPVGFGHVHHDPSIEVVVEVPRRGRQLEPRARWRGAELRGASGRVRPRRRGRAFGARRRGDSGGGGGARSAIAAAPRGDAVASHASRGALPVGALTFRTLNMSRGALCDVCIAVYAMGVGLACRVAARGARAV